MRSRPSSLDRARPVERVGEGSNSRRAQCTRPFEQRRFWIGLSSSQKRLREARSQSVGRARTGDPLRNDDLHRTPRQYDIGAMAALRTERRLVPGATCATAYRATDRVCHAEPTSMGDAATLGEIGSKGREVRDHRFWRMPSRHRPCRIAGPTRLIRRAAVWSTWLSCAPSIRRSGTVWTSVLAQRL